MKAKVTVKLKNGVLDPQGLAILHAAQSLGFSGIDQVRVGKVFELDLEENDVQRAREQMQKLSDKLLANPIIENFEVEILKST